MARPPSALLNDSADPFDRACVQVKTLENYCIRALEGKELRRLSVTEEDLFCLLVEYGLMRDHNGFAQKI